MRTLLSAFFTFVWLILLSPGYILYMASSLIWFMVAMRRIHKEVVKEVDGDTSDQERMRKIAARKLHEQTLWMKGFIIPAAFIFWVVFVIKLLAIYYEMFFVN